MFKRLFGGGDDAPKPKNDAAARKTEASTEEALQNLTKQIDDNIKREEFLNKKVDAHMQQIKDLLAKNQKARAKHILQQKKMVEKQIETLVNARNRLMETQMNLEMAQTNAQTVSSLSQAAQAQKNQMKVNNIENVEDVMDQIDEAAQQVEEINQAFARPNMAYDEDELDDELNMLAEEQKDEELSQMPGAPVTTVPGSEQLPAAPTRPAASAQEDEDAEIEALQREMGLAAQQ
eukprot:TRINITY_DN8804_c0_g2_i1.p1 TRINITY_DN8804_c0_g2~~TRINITY_DN8804_c0_g2_i1.p1  ORF type:complete len:234 (+),score=45.59 TRINITY_DN8804_c0_g2_i1:222-923(+)